MEIDWDIVKKVTLWSYEDLIKKVLKVLSYKFIQDHYFNSSFFHKSLNSIESSAEITQNSAHSIILTSPSQPFFLH